MPSYDYECTSCNHTFEAFQSMFDEPLKDCPRCGKTVRRIITGGSGIIFKGSGFYVTDNKKTSAIVSDKKKTAPDGGTDGKTAPESKAGTSEPASSGKEPVKSGTEN